VKPPFPTLPSSLPSLPFLLPYLTFSSLPFLPLPCCKAAPEMQLGGLPAGAGRARPLNGFCYMVASKESKLWA